ncbi:hypothetical protein AB6A40_003838 [Gnathostoma spinigerum]|uniref:Uncharacterized protein n=1 Tax=Gnathostoma spinigerum TaxID=75299 RepID=A0ABD6EAP6_9BILA
MNYALSGVPKLFYLPTSTREFSLAVRGSGKVYAGISVVLTKRHKLLRQPAGTSKHPVQITVKQSFDLPYILKQEVCLRFNDPLFTPVDITHGIYSGFSLKKRNIRLMPTALYYGVILNEPQISSFAAHIRLSQLQPNKDMCYEVLLDEPKIGYEPDSLAPVSIVVRHPFLDVIGETILTLRQRKGPSVLQEAVETVCWKSGCACSEISCSVRCSRCALLTNNTLHRELCNHNAFAAVVIVEAIRSVGEDIEEYYVLEAQFELFKSPSSPWFIQPGLTEFWLRKCNRRCLRPLVGEKYFVLGSIEGFVLDADARYHYVLREDDRWEHAEEKCANIFFLLLLFKSC